MHVLPKKITKLAETIEQNDGRAMLVGGCVRDALMGIEPKDWDLEIYGIEPVRLREILDSFGKVDAVGEAFTVYKLGNDLDVALPRRERKVGRGHKGFVVEGDAQMSFEEAAKRRDFTINAILQDALTGEIIDVYGGRQDIKNKILRVVSRETFAEDSLRVLRAAQFAARFEFEIDAETVEICRQIDLTDLPKERIWGEIEKLLLKARQPSIGLRWLYDLGVVEQLFPEMKALVGVPQEDEWHPEGDVDVHTLLVVDRAAELVDDLPYAKKVTVMLGALCHDYGKPATTRFFDGRWRSHAHDEAGVEPTISFLDRLGIYTLDGYDVRGQIIQLVRYHLKPGEFYKVRPGDGAFRRLARKVEPDLLYRVARADTLGRNADWIPRERWFDAAPQEWFIERARELAVETEAPKPILLGRHLIELGLTPSPDFKRILDAVYEMQLDGRIVDLDEAITEARTLIEDAKPTSEAKEFTEQSSEITNTNTKILLTCFIIGTGVIYFFSNPNPQFPYDYTFRVAENLLQGHVGFTKEQPSWLNEFVPFESYYYSVFPLGSVLTMLPFAVLKLIGIIKEMPAAFISAMTASGICLFLFLISAHYEHPWRKRILLAMGVLFGTWMWTNLAMAGAWQLALGFAMLGELGAIYFTVFNRRPLLAGLFFALAFGNRTEILLTAPIFIFLLLRKGFQSRETGEAQSENQRPKFEFEISNFKSQISKLAAFCLVPLILGIATLVYNYVRFHSFTDFGYARIPGVLDEPWYEHGIFSLRYIPLNFWEMLCTPWRRVADFPFLVPTGFGGSILWSSPFIVFTLRFGARRKVLKYAAWAAIIVLTFILWTHGNPGGWQFAYRYAMVLLPWMFLILLENSPEEITPLEWLAYFISFAVNAYATYLFFWTKYVQPY